METTLGFLLGLAVGLIASGIYTLALEETKAK